MNNSGKEEEKRDNDLEKLLEELKQDVTSAKELTAEARQAMVAYMRCSGMRMSEIASVLGVSDKTVRRDMGEIKARGG